PLPSTLFPYTTLFRSLPVLPVHEIVPVRNDVVDRAARHAERDAAVHAARTLHPGSVVGQAQVELAIVFLARLGRFVRLLEPLVRSEEHTSELQSRSDL